MSRAQNTGTLIEVTKSYIRPVMFVSLDFPTAALYLHDGVGVLAWGGFEWRGIGDYGGVEAIEEGDDVTPYSIRLRMSAMNTDLVTEVLGSDFSLRNVHIYAGFLTDGGALVDTPDEIWSGRTDVADIVTGAQAGVVLTCESDLAKFARSSGRLFSEAHLKDKYPDDTFFDYMPQMQDQQIIWTETRGGQVGSQFRGRASNGPSDPGRYYP